MSSDHNNIINLTNYEEYFILYMDDELTAEQKTRVEQFLQENPHLKTELDCLLNTKLPAEEITFTNKEELMSSQMKTEIIDEKLFLFLDNELNAEEKSRVETQLQSDAAYQLQYNSLLQTRLDPSDIIAYPDKKELYRHSAVVISFTTWMRIAAAVILVATASLLFVFYPNNHNNNHGVAIINTPVKVPTQISSPTTTLPQKENAIAQQQSPSKEVESKEVKARMLIEHPAAVQQLATRENTPAIKNIIKLQPIQLPQSNNQIAVNIPTNDIITTTPVTNATPATYNHSEDVAVNKVPEVSNPDAEPRYRGSVKGFLRKAARTIERRTGIGTANADEEVLIGAVAVKL
jgi:hypothetical protein